MIQLFHVTKAYGDEPPTLDDLTLNIEKGEFIWLTGPSGAGKTTLLKLLFCAEAPTSGQILVGGRNVNRLTQAGVPILRRSIGVVFQDFKLLANRTVAENVGFALEVLGASDREIEERALKRLDQVGLRQKSRALPRTLSGGEQQRVAIARALGPGPALIFADEPTGNLDAATGTSVMDLLFARVAAANATLVLITHDLALARRCARVIEMRDGRIVGERIA